MSNFLLWRINQNFLEWNLKLFKLSLVEEIHCKTLHVNKMQIMRKLEPKSFRGIFLKRLIFFLFLRMKL